MTAGTELPAYLPYPRFLLETDLSHTARELYALLLDRSTLSQKNGWQDSEGRTYIVYPIAEIAEMLDKGCTTIKGALNELDAAGLLERRRTGFSAANRLYVKVPPIPVVQFSDQLTDGKPPLIRAGNRPTDSRKTDLMTVGKPSPNQTNINNLIESQTKGASEGQPPAAYGRYKNVFLSDTELLELEQDFPGKWEYYLDRLSCHIASTGKQYQSMQPPFTSGAGGRCQREAKERHTGLFIQGGRKPMTDTIHNTILPMTATTAEPEDYTGEDGLLYCGKCRKPKEAYFPEGKTFFGRDRHPSECDCQRAARKEREAAEKRRSHLETVERLKRQGFTDKTMQDWTFANDNGSCPQMKNAAGYVARWEQIKDGNYGLLLWGRVGTGKSYFAGCIANALMEQEVPVCMTNFAAILNDLAASFAGRNEYISRLCSFPLLIIDDFGMERGTEYGLEQVYNVIDSRYRSRKPLIVTTNLTLEELQHPEDTAHARIYDRLLEMCSPLCFTGENLRKAAAQGKMEQLKRLLAGKEICL